MTVAISSTQVPELLADSLLMAQIHAGDPAALAQLYESYPRIVYSVALRVLHDPCAAEDVLQDVFLGTWRKPASFVRARGSRGGWFAIISRNRSIDVLRRRHPMQSVDDIPLHSTIDVINDVACEITSDRVKLPIESLPEPQKEILELAFFSGWTHAEIAERRSLPLGTVKTKIRTAQTDLRAALMTQSPLPRK